MVPQDNREIFCRPTEERALLSYCMKDITHYFSICSKLSPSDFLYPEHETLMIILGVLVSRGAEKLEPNLVVAEASVNGVLDSVGGVKYIKTIYDMFINPENFSLYLESVVEAATKYKLYNILFEKIHKINSNAKEGLTSADLLSNVESDLLSLSMTGLNINEPIDFADGISDYIEDRRENRIILSGLSTGYPILDKQIDGMIDGTLTIVAARKKMGKSALLSNIALHVAYQLDKPVLYVDTELTFEEWRNRSLAIISGVKERDIKHGGYDDTTYANLKKAERLIAQRRLFHEYMPGYSVDKLVALYRKYKHKENIGLIVFDYLKEPDSSSIDRQRKEYQVLGDVTTKLKDLAGQMKIPALTAVQLNRDNDVADSDRIARYADIVCFWSDRDKKEVDLGGYSCGTHKLVIRDTRRGGATNNDGIGYFFFKETIKIKEVSIDNQYFTNFNEVTNVNGADVNDSESNEELL